MHTPELHRLHRHRCRQPQPSEGSEQQNQFFAPQPKWILSLFKLPSSTEDHIYDDADADMDTPEGPANENVKRQQNIERAPPTSYENENDMGRMDANTVVDEQYENVSCPVNNQNQNENGLIGEHSKNNDVKNSTKDEWNELFSQCLKATSTLNLDQVLEKMLLNLRDNEELKKTIPRRAIIQLKRDRKLRLGRDSYWKDASQRLFALMLKELHH